MLLDIDHHSGIPIYRQIMDQVRDQIMAGLLKEGEQLMAVRELAGQLKVNPMTVSKAYSAMEAEGILERRRGIGLFVATIHSDKKMQAKEAALETQLARAVTTAIQYDISREDAQQLLEKLFDKHMAKKRRTSK
jgi:GntR family transcriptional regulator